MILNKDNPPRFDVFVLLSFWVVIVFGIFFAKTVENSCSIIWRYSNKNSNFAAVYKTNYYLLLNYLIISTMAYVISDDCVACGTCMDMCPTGAISEGDIYVIDPDTCISCGSCAEACPNEAISEG